MITRRIYGCLPFLMYCKFSSLNFTCALCDILGSNSFHFLRIMGIWPLAPMGVPFIHSYADEFIHQKIPWSAWKRCLPALKDFKVSILAAIGTVWMQLPGSQINALSSSDSFCECGFIQGLGSVCGLGLSIHGPYFLFAFGPINMATAYSPPSIALGLYWYPTLRFLGFFLWAYQTAYLIPENWNSSDWFSVYT